MCQRIRKSTPLGIPFVIALGGLALFLAASPALRAEEPLDLSWARRPTCALWDREASEAVLRHVTLDQDAVDLRQLNEAITHIRRARRICDLGSSQAACQEYQAALRAFARASIGWRISNCPQFTMGQKENETEAAE